MAKKTLVRKKTSKNAKSTRQQKTKLKAKRPIRKKSAPKRKASPRKIKKTSAAPARKSAAKHTSAKKRTAANNRILAAARHVTTSTSLERDEDVKIPRARIKKPDTAENTGAGDYQNISNEEDVDSESARELLEEGQAFEAGIVSAVEDAPIPEKGDLRTHEVREDDVPLEYDDDDRP